MQPRELFSAQLRNNDVSLSSFKENILDIKLKDGFPAKVIGENSEIQKKPDWAI